MKWLYRLGSLCAVFAVTLSFLIVPASAAETAASSMAYDFRVTGSSVSGTFNLPRYASSYLKSKTTGSLTAGNKYYLSMHDIALDEERLFTGSVAMYISYYFNTDATADGVWVTQDNATYQGYYTNDVGGSGSTNVEIDYFTPSTDGTNLSRGYRMSAHFEGYPNMPISALGIRRTSTAAQIYFSPNVNVASNLGTNWYILVPSATVVGTATSEELSALEGMADSIAAQNEILNAMYGDIVSICNSIYQQTGDLLAAQNLTNQYFSQLIPILNGIQTNTGNTATNTANIYSLLASQFQLLISTIESESFDIQQVIKGESKALQDAVDDAADKIIDYFTSLYSYGGQEIIDHNTTNGNISDASQNEINMSTSLIEGLTTLPAVDFSGGVSDGISSVVALFSAMWQVLAPLHPYFYFSWIFGICLVLVGRKSRSDS